MRKKLAVLLTLVLIISLSVGTASHKKAYAKEAQMYLELPESVKKEQEFTVKVILNSDVNLYSIDAYLSYSTETLEFIPDNELVTGTDGVLELKDIYGEETKKAEYELTFKALDTGTAEIGLTDVYLIDYTDLDYITVAPSVKHFNVGINRMVEEDARLEELIAAPGELTEEFDPDKLDYEMHVGLDVDYVGVSAIPMDEESVVGLEMPEKLVDGENLITITVTALSGNVNTYTIKVIRKDWPEETSEEVTEEQTTEAGSEQTTEAEETEADTQQEDSTEASTAETPATEEQTTEVPVNGNDTEQTTENTDQNNTDNPSLEN